MPARRENGPVNRRGTLGQGRGAAGRDWSGGPATGQFQFAIPQGDPLESRLTRLHPLADPRGVEGVDGQHVAALNLPPFGGDPGPFQLLHEGFDQGLGREGEPARLQPHEFNAQAMVGSDGEPEPGAGDGLRPARGLKAGGEHAFVGLKLQAGLRNAGGPEAGVPGFDLTDEPGIDLPVGEPEGEGRFVAKFVEKLQGLLSPRHASARQRPGNTPTRQADRSAGPAVSRRTPPRTHLHPPAHRPAGQCLARR